MGSLVSRDTLQGFRETQLGRGVTTESTDQELAANSHPNLRKPENDINAKAIVFIRDEL